MPEYVRVTDKDTGHKASIPASRVPHGNFTVLKADAVDPVTGDVLPPEFKTESKPTPTKAAAPRTARKRAARKATAPKSQSSTPPSGQQAETDKEQANG